jgi:predicted nuclease of predicted toxin-antitoxin system
VSGSGQETGVAATTPALPRLLTNENFPRPALLALRAAGLDVESVTERMLGATDAIVLLHAAQTGRWIVTFDRDYGELVFARKVPPPPAIIYLRQGAYALTWPADAVLAVLAQADFAIGHLVVVQDRTLRRRPLPLPASPAP